MSPHKSLATARWQWKLFCAFVFTAAAYIIQAILFPISIGYRLDDWFVLPERVWFKSDAAWLKHLVFFDKTRFTWIGSFFLCRPGLFAWIWWQDAFFRAHPEVHHYIAACATVFAFSALFLSLRRVCGDAAALCATAYAFTASGENILFTWPHINPYVIALGFYALGACSFASIDQSKSGNRQVWLTGFFFLVAEFFHEFVAISLVLLILYELIEAFGSTRDVTRIETAQVRRLAVLTIVLGVFATIWIASFLMLRPPSFYSPEVSNASLLDWHRLESILIVQIYVCLKLLYSLVPFVHSPVHFSDQSFGLAIVRAAMFSALIVCSTTWMFLAKFRFKASPYEKKLLATAFFPVIAILVGLSGGRIAIGWSVNPWYFQMETFFLVMTLVIIFVPSLRQSGRSEAGSRATSTLVIVVCLLSSIRLAAQMQARNRNEALANADLKQTSKTIVAFFDRHPESCFSGMLNLSFRHLMDQQTSIAMQSFNCESRSGRPVYLIVDKSGTPRSWAEIASDGWARTTSMMNSLEWPQSTNELATFLNLRKYNVREPAGAIRDRGIAQVRKSRSRATYSELVAEFKTNDHFPILYHVGLKLEQKNRVLYLMLVDEILHLLIQDPKGDLIEIAQSQVSEIKPQFSLKIVQTPEACEIFFDRYLLMDTRDCLKERARVSVLDYPNGTLEQRLVDLRFRLKVTAHPRFWPLSPVADGMAS